jgi:hypothetical protein
VIDQGRGELRFPITDGFVTEFNPPDQEHFRQIPQAQFVPKTPEDHERDDVGRVLRAVQNSTTALVELLATGTTPEASVPARGSLRPFGNFRRVARHAPHFLFSHPGQSYAGTALLDQSVLARRMTEPSGCQFNIIAWMSQ